MQSYKEVCDNEDEIWFQLQKDEQETFLQWAKALGCVCLNGKEIQPKEELSCFHYAITKNGLLARISLFAWFSKNGQFDHVKRYTFQSFVKDNLITLK